MYIDLEKLAENNTDEHIDLRCDYVNNKMGDFLAGDNYKVAVECGTRDAIDLMVFSGFYSVDKSYAFECNPYAIDLCRRNLKYSDIDIKLIEKAVYNKDEKISFYSVDAVSENSNIGASSILQNSNIDEPVTKIEVDAIRLDTFMEQEEIDQIDILIMDLQETELIALEGLGERIADVKKILLEGTMTCENTYYNEGCTIEQIKEFLESNGFEYTACDHDYWQIRLQTILRESPELRTVEWVDNYRHTMHALNTFTEEENYQMMLEEVESGKHKFFGNFLFSQK